MPKWARLSQIAVRPIDRLEDSRQEESPPVLPADITHTLVSKLFLWYLLRRSVSWTWLSGPPLLARFHRGRMASGSPQHGRVYSRSLEPCGDLNEPGSSHVGPFRGRGRDSHGEGLRPFSRADPCHELGYHWQPVISVHHDDMSSATSTSPAGRRERQTVCFYPSLSLSTHAPLLPSSCMAHPKP